MTVGKNTAFSFSNVTANYVFQAKLYLNITSDNLTLTFPAAAVFKGGTPVWTTGYYILDIEYHPILQKFYIKSEKAE